jgi:hypothetical protein
MRVVSIPLSGVYTVKNAINIVATVAREKNSL